MYRRFIFGQLFTLSLPLLLSACSRETSQHPADETIHEAEAASTSADIAETSSRHLDGNVAFDATLDLKTSASGCTNSGGPFIRFDGAVIINDGLSALVTASNNAKGTHKASVVVDAAFALLDQKYPIVLDKGGAKGVGGNPHIYATFYDDFGSPIGREIYLGRCNKLGSGVKFDFKSLGHFTADVIAGNCSGAGGPTVNLVGDIVFGGIHVNLTFMNNQKGTKSANVLAEAAFILSPPGGVITFNKSNRYGDGVGGNPFLSATLVDGYVNPISPVFEFGRCNKIGR